ncbi:preprotein translocase subunit SecG [Shewanella mangrovi]|uniref:Protein-export membrane protein SecG n=1 Tax=Shewanella mangrovi TaxID=1515746 RepID=A0A094JG10_9GAMM|nr:preprotein translocase subunit SecG [Shewanella mangrovi]KFZ36969.1 preprotein translocase subunit SecG [Shewanella mangrovi]
MYQVLIVVYLLVALALIGLILIQQGKGADMGASFGAGASATLFGSSGSGNFLTRSTAILAILFFVLSLAIGNMSANHAKQEDSWQDLGAAGAVKTEQQAPVTPAPQKSEEKIPD